MRILGKPQGIFDLENSDNFVGSFLKKEDIKQFMKVKDSDLNFLEFKNIDGMDVIGENEVRDAWYGGKIPNAPERKGRSFDELILLSIFQKALPGAEIKTQVRVKTKGKTRAISFPMDFKIKYKEKYIWVEFDGPDHFARGRYGPPKHEPFRKKKMVEDETQIEVVNWGYWIQRCESNAKVLFDQEIKGLGALWSTNFLFGDFYFSNSLEIIETINNRFNANRNGYGYFYGPNTAKRNIPEHPIIEKIRSGKVPIERILPPRFIDIEKWVPNQLNLNLNNK